MDRNVWTPRDLPPFPAIAAKMLFLLSSEDAAVERIVGLIQADPALSAGLLRMANSALFALDSEVRTIRHAVTVLGFERVRNVTLTLTLAGHLRAALRLKPFRRCWSHSVACAILAEEFGAACAVAPDFAYTAGLLHDLGRLGLLMAYPSDYAELLAEAHAEPYDLLEAERQWFGLDHCAAGRQLVEEWKLPPELGDIAGHHHAARNGSAAGALGVTRLACRAAGALGYQAARCEAAPSFEDATAALPEHVRARFGSDPEALRIRIGCLLESVG